MGSLGKQWPKDSPRRSKTRKQWSGLCLQLRLACRSMPRRPREERTLRDYLSGDCFLETTIQHFPNLQGEYFFTALTGKSQLERISPHITSIRKETRYSCVPLGCAMDDGTAEQPRNDRNGPWNSWRNKILTEVAGGYPGVYVAPFGVLTAELSDIHMITRHRSGYIYDCSHWCYSPGVVEATAKLLFEAVRAHDNGVPPGHVTTWFSHDTNATQPSDMISGEANRRD